MQDVQLKNKQCPYCGSHKTSNGNIMIGAVGGVFVLIGIFFRFFIIVGFIIIAIAILFAILEALGKKKKSYSCQECFKSF